MGSKKSKQSKWGEKHRTQSVDSKPEGEKTHTPGLGRERESLHDGQSFNNVSARNEIKKKKQRMWSQENRKKRRRGKSAEKGRLPSDSGQKRYKGEVIREGKNPSKKKGGEEISEIAGGEAREKKGGKKREK